MQILGSFGAVHVRHPAAGRWVNRMGWRRFLFRARWHRERLEEIESYVRIETDENVSRGMSSAEALAAARRKFGNRTLIQEDIYRMNTISWLDMVIRDLRYTLRLLRRSPVFACVTLLTLAIGIGANTAVFGILNSVLFKPLPYPNPEELVAVWNNAPGAAGLATITGGLHLSASMYFTFAEQNRTLQAIGLWTASTANVTGLAEPEKVPAIFVTDGALETLNVPPALGRWLEPADQKPNGAATAMLGYGYWQRRFGGDRSVIGRSIVIDSVPAEIVGVMPRNFRFVNQDFDLIQPLAFDRAALRLPGFSFDCLARLKAGVTIAEADADLARLVPVWMGSWPPAAPGLNPRIYETWRITPALRSLKQEVVGNVGSVLWVVMATIGIVLLIACANVANLSLVRAESRQQELAVRAALGARRGAIIRGLLLESILLALIGGALGLALADAALRLVIALGPGSLPRLAEISLDARSLAVTFCVSLLAGILFGSVTALKYAGPRIFLTLRAGRAMSSTRERQRLRSILVIAQVALALVLLIGSGLMIRTVQKLFMVQPGFAHPETIQTMRIFIPPSLISEPERVARAQNEILDKVAAIPGVEAVGFASEMPMDGIPGDWDAIRVEGKTDLASRLPPLRTFKTASPGLFRTQGTRLIAGRDYTWSDLYGRRPVVILSENLARELWGSANAAVGKRIAASLPSSPWREVIGVVEDVHEHGLQEPSPAIVYWPTFGDSKYVAGRVEVQRAVTFAIRSQRAGSADLLTTVRRAVWSVNSSLPVAAVRTMQEIYRQSLARTSFTVVMLAIAAVMALLLGVIGIYGVISYAVSQRKREIGIRLALGAPPRGLSRMFVRYALTLAGTGAGIGIAVAIGLTRLMAALLFGVSPLDPATYVAVPVILVVAAASAAYLPARRAARVDPVETLRAE